MRVRAISMFSSIMEMCRGEEGMEGLDSEKKSGEEEEEEEGGGEDLKKMFLIPLAGMVEN